ncbi:MAG TPA: hypothetical protein VNR39_11535 [Pseudolabrys sp.]|nr:hypothetical protein [Pseudolabrys sp.]
MAKMILNVAVFGFFLLVVCVLGFFLWKTLFTPETYGQIDKNTEIARSSGQPSKQGSGGDSSSSNGSKSTEEAIADYTKWLAIFTLFLVLATIGLFISGERNVEVARKSADAARQSAEASKYAVELSDRTAERQLRAYISPHSGMVLDLAGAYQTEPFSLRIIFKNSGQTPAYSFTAEGGVAFDKYPLAQPLQITDGPSGPSVIGPAGEYTLNVGMKALTKEQWDALMSNTAAIYVHGKFRYRDAFKKDRRGSFLYFYGGAGGLRIDRALTFYHEGNDAD